MDHDVDLVTGAFGNTGQAITSLLHSQGRRVRTLTGHPPTDAGAVEVRPFTFDDPDALADAFRGVRTFFNTYWMRTGDESGYETAVARCTALIDAATRAGVERIVHLSVAHPSLDSPYPYFRAKARVEQVLRECAVPSAVVRPALIFGGESALLHNLAWLMRRLPVFGVAAGGDYRVRPVHVDDVARLCVDGATAAEPTTVDAVGPERPTFRELLVDVRDSIGARTRLVGMPPWMVVPSARLLGVLLRDELLTRDELLSTIDGLADTDGPATGTISLAAWIDEHAATLGRSRVQVKARPSKSPEVRQRSK